MAVSVKKMRIVPIGEKEEVDRAYNYIRNGIYNQYRILNTYMSQVGTLFYSCNRNTESEDFTSGFEKIFADVESAYNNLSYMAFGDYLRNMESEYKKHMKDLKGDAFKQDYNAIFRNKNSAIWDIEQAKGLGMAGNCGMRVKQDFTTALKNGLAKGERQLPFYKRDFPLLVPSRFLTFYTQEEEYVDTNTGEKNTRTNFCIKFVNGINFKVVLGPSGRRDTFLPSLLDSIINDPEHYKLGGSSIQLTKKNKIILNLTTKVELPKEKYKPVKGRTMGLAMGYDKCLVAALSDSKKVFELGNSNKESIVERRISIQKNRERIQKACKGPEGSGHGRKRKMRDFYQLERREKNVVRYYNHHLSKEVVEFAKKYKVEAIVIEDVNLEELENYPVLLRNWSYYQLQNFITYKAGPNIVVKKHESKDVRTTCCNCGCRFTSAFATVKDELQNNDGKITKVVELPEKIEWQQELYFTCPSCKKRIELSYNKAKNMSVMG